MQHHPGWIATLSFLIAVPIWGPVALAQGSPPSQPPSGAGAAGVGNPLLGPCKDDIAKLCGGVKVGGGKVIACLKEHQAELSEACKGSLSGPGRGGPSMEPTKAGAAAQDLGRGAGPMAGRGRMQADWGPMKGIQQDCKEDIAKFCKDVETGHGRVVSCLNDHVGELSPACKALVPGLMTQMNAPMKPHADCADDAKKLCGDVKPGSGRMGFCLGEHSAELSPACKKQVDAMKARWDKGPVRGRGAKAGKGGAAPSTEAAPPPAK